MPHCQRACCFKSSIANCCLAWRCLIPAAGPLRHVDWDGEMPSKEPDSLRSQVFQPIDHNAFSPYKPAMHTPKLTHPISLFLFFCFRSHVFRSIQSPRSHLLSSPLYLGAPGAPSTPPCRMCWVQGRISPHDISYAVSWNSINPAAARGTPGFGLSPDRPHSSLAESTLTTRPHIPPHAPYTPTPPKLHHPKTMYITA